MFEDSLFVSDFASRKRSRGARGTVLVSVVLQATAVAGFVLVPLIWPDSLTQLHAQPRVAELLLKRTPKIKEAPVKPRVVQVETSSKFQAPAQVERTPEVSHASGALHSVAPAVDEAPALLAYGKAMGGILTGRLELRAGAGSGNGSVVVRAAPERKDGPVRVSSGVSSGLLLQPIRPVYPQIAVSARVEGTVIIRAVIDGRGQIVGAEVVSGPAMLRTAALDAVRTARYRPYLLNGSPTDVETTISVNFRLSS